MNPFPQARAKLIPGIVIFLQKMWRGAVCRLNYRRMLAAIKILRHYRLYKMRTYMLELNRVFKWVISGCSSCLIWFLHVFFFSSWFVYIILSLLRLFHTLHIQVFCYLLAVNLSHEWLKINLFCILLHRYVYFLFSIAFFYLIKVWLLMCIMHKI